MDVCSDSFTIGTRTPTTRHGLDRGCDGMLVVPIYIGRLRGFTSEYFSGDLAYPSEYF